MDPEFRMLPHMELGKVRQKEKAAYSKVMGKEEPVTANGMGDSV